jgi:hypothetical protein
MEPYDAIVIGGGHNGLVAAPTSPRGVPARSSSRPATRSAAPINMGFAWVPIAKAAVGKAHRDRLARRPDEATVTALPFLDPKKEIPAKG